MRQFAAVRHSHDGVLAVAHHGAGFLGGQWLARHCVVHVPAPPRSGHQHGVTSLPTPILLPASCRRMSTRLSNGGTIQPMLRHRAAVFTSSHRRYNIASLPQSTRRTPLFRCAQHQQRRCGRRGSTVFQKARQGFQDLPDHSRLQPSIKRTATSGGSINAPKGGCTLVIRKAAGWFS